MNSRIRIIGNEMMFVVVFSFFFFSNKQKKKHVTSCCILCIPQASNCSSRLWRRMNPILNFFFFAHLQFHTEKNLFSFFFGKHKTRIIKKKILCKLVNFFFQFKHGLSRFSYWLKIPRELPKENFECKKM